MARSAKSATDADPHGHRLSKCRLLARSYDKILKMSRTVADLAEADEIHPEHLAEAVQYRSLDRQWWR